MITVEYCNMMAAYNVWMNTRLYEVCASITDVDRRADRGAFFRSIHGSLNHLMYGDLAFMSRFTGDPAEVPELGVDLYDRFDDLRSAREHLDRRLVAFASTLTDDWLRGSLTYVSKVDARSRTVARWVLAVHMFNHQTHHRGQITTLLSQMQLDIGSTDLPFMPPTWTAGP